MTGIAIEGFRKLVKLCCTNGYFHLKVGPESMIFIQYGPLGSFLRKNIHKEWLFSSLNNVDVHVYPTEFLPFDRRSMNLYDTSGFVFSESLLDIFEKNAQIFGAIGSYHSFGIAAYGPSLEEMDLNQTKLFQNNSVFRSLKQKYWLTIAFFCPKKKAPFWFNYWSRYRYRWWRKLSSMPSNFSMSDVTETSGNQETSLMLQFPWGNETIETIFLCNSVRFEDSCKWDDEQEKLKNSFCDISVILCDAELNLATLAYISNSLSEKWRGNEIKNLFQFHAKLAPYKVCLLPDSKDSSTLKSLFEVVKHLEKELKMFGIEVYPCIESNSSPETLEHFKKSDEMGIPYTIILSDKALATGIVALRNRDTTLEEEVHIAEITQKLLKYLQIKTF